jgi:DNA-binding response OmpR family regulator
MLGAWGMRGNRLALHGECEDRQAVRHLISQNDKENETMRVIVVDPDTEVRHDLVNQLRKRQFDPTGVDDAASLYRDLAARPCDAVILEQTLPGEDGLSVASYLRKISRIGIVMLSHDASLEHRLSCLTSGADVCLTKPVDMRELVATLGSLNRRANGSLGVLAAANSAATAWTLMSNTWQLISPTGASIGLTSSECSLLSLLMQKSGAAVSRQEIVAEFGHDFRYYDERRLEAIVSRLRRKLEPHQGSFKPLKTAHGFGYAFTAPASIR